ncbi:hypothetical protein RHMOL_Rhmol01G0318700 [Rhododendron molle]|uniref:Uncharacterized protein n=1 Tax=Rhododendron molle TaxID=49168 RepID=A0ACC0Q988_RHOML|nr:hypothetical protein RHMOL_Rhmol01G0318700 [Rhododendron molle]
MYQHQRSRVRWLRYGDNNTSFLDATVIQRRQRNQLVKIRDDRGECNRGEWKELLKDLVTETELKAIETIPLSLFKRLDFMVWHFNSSVVYTVKSGYQVAFNIQRSLKKEKPEPSFKADPSVWKCIWKLKTMAKGWLPPPVGHIKANCDVAMSNEGRDAMAAVILRNSRGEVVDGAVKGFKVDSVLQGELQAIRLACATAKDQGWQSLMVESDCKQATELCVNELVPPWNCTALAEDIKEMAEERSTTLQWI